MGTYDEGIGEDFLAEVYRLCLILVVLASAPLALLNLHWALSFVLGAGVSVASLRTLEVVVRRRIVPNQRRAKWAVRLLALVKIPLIAVLFYILAKQSWLSAPALAGGLGLVYVAISLKGFWISGVQLLRARSR